MSDTLQALDIADFDRQDLIERSKDAIQADKQCRIALAATATIALPLLWNAGGRTGRDTIITVEPGKSVVQPLSKAQAWFGPFTVPSEYRGADERRKEKLRKFWADEKARYLNRYDYPRPLSVAKGGYEPIGPHRSPDVTITIIEADGSENAPIRLYELYKIGEFDPLKDSFGDQETAAQVKERYEAELASVSQQAEARIQALQTQMAELAGLVKGRLFTTEGK